MLSASLIQLEYASKHWKSTFSYLSWYTLIRPTCQHMSAERPWEVRKQRGRRIKCLSELRRDGTCSRRPACSGDPQSGCLYGGGNLRLNGLHWYLVQRVGALLVLLRADYCTVGGWGSRTHQPLGCRHDKRRGGIPMIPSDAFLGEGEVYLRGERILLKDWPE